MAAEALDRRIQAGGITPTVIPLNNFREILRHPPFNKIQPGDPSLDQGLHVVCDIDGVVSHPLKRGSAREGLQTLQTVAESTKALTVWSARKIPKEHGIVWTHGMQQVFDSQGHQQRGGISRFPFLSRTSFERITDLVHAANPECEVDFLVGGGKLNGSKHFSTFAHGLLEQGKQLVIIGSSIFERRGVKQLVNDLGEHGNIHLVNQMRYFDTQGLVL